MTTLRRGSDGDWILPGERCEITVTAPDLHAVACGGWPEAVWYIDNHRAVTCHAHDAALRAVSGSDGPITGTGHSGSHAYDNGSEGQP